MPLKYHPLVQATKIELEKIDKKKDISWEEQKKYNSQFLPISVEPKLRKRALKFMNDLILLLEANNHSIQFEYDNCHIEMYGQLTEINLRQKYFRKRTMGKRGYSHETYEKSNKLEFQIGSYARKGWIDKDNKTLEECLPAIYSQIEKESIRWAELRERQRIEEEKREAQRKIEEEIAIENAIEKEKWEKLVSDAQNHKIANDIRSYLKAFEQKIKDTNGLFENEFKEYIHWAYNQTELLDPLNRLNDFKNRDLTLYVPHLGKRCGA
ncbi:hypothetical protein [Aequorivita lipolytica]|uniref:Uncharacterized protein n=1 Tax=Aequorivita lipolytica TaxID=153267 RepID=A0A5C6YTC5_9FLAO|nr:hypothetical protein [Aequorivita lipolytica]TXD70579.1 hypothetical protein ESV24_00350 [Aequorivita lipolytica]SRX49608.1 hypothetical protein AEQU2_00071 [Aequorivita lipolytica]